MKSVDTTSKHEIQNKPTYRRYTLVATILPLLIIAASVLILNTKQTKSDPASEKIIREAAAAQLNKDPNDLNDEDVAKITDFTFTARKRLKDIRVIEKFTNLQKLTLAYLLFPDREMPKWMVILERFGISYYQKKFALDLSPLEKLSKLQELSLHASEVHNIKSLKHLKNLNKLTLSGTHVKNIKPLSGLTKLRELSLRGISISNFKPLKKLYNLQEIDLSFTGITNLEPLSGLKNLRSININNTLVSDLEPLKKLKNLKIIYMYNCSYITDEQVEDLQKALPNLKIESERYSQTRQL